MAKAVVVLAVFAFLQSLAFPQNPQFLAMVSASVAPLLGGQPNDVQESGSLGVLPATLSGDFPCADCDGIRYQLNLFPDHFFLSRMVYQGRSSTLDNLGIWEVSQDGKTLHLSGGRGSVDKFSGPNLDLFDGGGKRVARFEAHASE